MPEGSKLLYPWDEAAEVLGIAPVTVSRLVGLGRLQSVNIGPRQVRITASSMRQYIESRKAKKEKD